MAAYGPPEDSPLNQKDYSRLQEALSNLSRARRKIELAKEAGIDCEQREAECEYLEQAISKKKAVYFPHKP
jgi:hypothetical protein